VAKYQPPQARLVNKRGATRVRATPVQTELLSQDSDYGKKHRCETHAIDYYIAADDQVKCPMCQLMARFDDVRADLIVAENKLELATNQLKKLEPQVNLQSAIKAALEILDDNDYSWLKVQMYQYKIEKSVSLKPTHGKLEGGRRLRRGEKLPTNGFMTVPRHGDPEAHAATSFGGIAMAEYLDEAITIYGSAQAMGIMLKAWWKALPGGAR